MIRFTILLLACTLCGCKPSTLAEIQAGPPSDEAFARAALRDNGCIHCHTIDGLDGATGRVGPPLTGLRERTLIAGQHPNNLDNLTRFILDPRAMSPGSAMPKTVDDEAQARAIAAFLYRLD